MTGIPEYRDTVHRQLKMFLNGVYTSIDQDMRGAAVEYEPRSKFIVYVKCVIKLVSPLSFYRFSVFLFLHILTIIYLCLSIVLKRVHLDPHPWRFLFARAGAHLCFCPCLSGPPSRCLGALTCSACFVTSRSPGALLESF